jgi:hypothetical protein
MLRKNAMQNELIIGEFPVETLSTEPRISALAVASLVSGMLGPFFAGAMWVLSFSRFITLENTLLIAVFSCGFAWILGLVFGAKSIAQIDDSEGRLFGKEYALVGAAASAAWMILVLAGVLMPAIFCINS